MGTIELICHMTRLNFAESQADAEEEPLEGAETTGVDAFTLGDAVYEGEWKSFNGVIKRHGKGVFTTEEFKYEGEFCEDEFHGHGILALTVGSLYQGQFVHGKMTGYGEMTFIDGSQYKGEWRNGRMHGIGTFITIEGQTWTGPWCHGMSACPLFPQLGAAWEEEEEEEMPM